MVNFVLLVQLLQWEYNESTMYIPTHYDQGYTSWEYGHGTPIFGSMHHVLKSFLVKTYLYYGKVYKIKFFSWYGVYLEQISVNLKIQPLATGFVIVVAMDCISKWMIQ